MMRQRMMRLGDADLRIGRGLCSRPYMNVMTRVMSALIRQQLQVVEQLGVLVEAIRNARGPRHVGDFSARSAPRSSGSAAPRRAATSR